MGGVCCILVREAKCIKGSDRKFQVRLLGRCMCRQTDNKKNNLRDIGWRVVVWNYLAPIQTERDVFEHGNEPSGLMK